jgi:hypothetical protein
MELEESVSQRQVKEDTPSPVAVAPLFWLRRRSRPQNTLFRLDFDLTFSQSQRSQTPRAKVKVKSTNSHIIVIPQWFIDYMHEVSYELVTAMTAVMTVMTVMTALTVLWQA